ncbi:MAG: tetratricopeptide repeat protein [Nitrospinae bacterium]|nr:tetratricopeptide repeat protein [Nitrospinota bacterium]
MKNQNEAQKYFEAGNAYYNNGNYLKACGSYMKAIEKDPDFALAYNNWGLSLHYLKRYDEAIERYKIAVEKDPNYALAYYNWGNAILELKRYDEAIERYKIATEKDPNYALAYYNWGIILSELKRYDEAIERYKITTEKDPNYAPAYYNWGIILSELKRYDEAIERYKIAVEKDPNYAPAYNNWGLSLHILKRYDEAIERYKIATEKDPNYALAYYNWGIILSELKRYDEAIERYKTAVEKDPNFYYAYHNRAYCLWLQGKYKESREEWEKTKKAYEEGKEGAKNSHNANYFQYFGKILHDTFGELVEAEKIYKEGLELDPDHTGILIGLVNLYLEKRDEEMNKNGDYDNKAANSWEALKFYKKAEMLLEGRIKETEDAQTFLQLGEMHLIMEEYQRAEENFLSVLKKYEDWEMPYFDLGVLYTHKEDFKNAIQYFEKAVKLNPYSLTVRSNLAGVYLKVNLKEKAESEYKNILKITQNHIESQIGLGEVYTAMGDDGDIDMYDQAINHYTEGIKISQLKIGSKRLRKRDLAAIYYSRAYARIKLYETSKTIKDEGILYDAMKDFNNCFANDHGHNKAKRAKEKLEKRLSRFSPQRFMEKGGPPLIVTLSLITFILSTISFFFGKPNDYIKDPLHYAVLTFGSLIFMVAGLYLPQILKLKVGSVELEKSPVEQITTQIPLGISR